MKGKKQNVRLLQKDRRTNVEGWRDTDAARDWLARQAASRSSQVVGGESSPDRQW